MNGGEGERWGRAVAIGVGIPVGLVAVIIGWSASPVVGVGIAVVILAGGYVLVRRRPAGPVPEPPGRAAVAGATEVGSVSDAPGETKPCPDCAETVLVAARVCRFCGHRFDIGLSATDVRRSEKSAFGAAALSLLIPGLGQFYLDEPGRAGVFFAAFCALLVAAFATNTLGAGWVVGIIALIDAYEGAGVQRETCIPRGVTRRAWVVLAVSVALAVVAIAASPSTV